MLAKRVQKLRRDERHRPNKRRKTSGTAIATKSCCHKLFIWSNGVSVQRILKQVPEPQAHHKTYRIMLMLGFCCCSSSYFCADTKYPLQYSWRSCLTLHTSATTQQTKERRQRFRCTINSKSMILLHLIILMDTSLLRFVYVWETASRMFRLYALHKYKVCDEPNMFCFDRSTLESDRSRKSNSSHSSKQVIIWNFVGLCEVCSFPSPRSLT